MPSQRWVNKTIADLRERPCTRSERVSQALFGTPVSLCQHTGEWCLVETPDHGQGFIETRHLAGAVRQKGGEWKLRQAIVPVRSPSTDQVLTRLAFDTRFFAQADNDRLVFTLPTGERGYVRKEAAVAAGSRLGLEQLEQLARSFVGTPYLWGGISPFGFDCSGFIQRLFHYCFNEWLPRDTVDQCRIGEQTRLEDLKRGDLCFFPGHVAPVCRRGLDRSRQSPSQRGLSRAALAPGHPLWQRAP